MAGGGAGTCQFENNYFTEMCSGSEAGSYLRLIDVVYHSTLGLSVIKKRRRPVPQGAPRPLPPPPAPPATCAETEAQTEHTTLAALGAVLTPPPLAAGLNGS